MADYVLSVWTAGDMHDGGSPIRLCRVGESMPLAEHPAGFDTSEFRFDGVVVDPEDSLTEAGLLNDRCKEAVGAALWDRLAPGTIGPALRPLLARERIYLDLRSGDLLRYPWELLRYDGAYLFATAGIRWSLGRPEPTEHYAAGAPSPAGHPLRVLVVLGNDPQDSRIRAEEELLIIEREAHRRNAEVLLRALHHPGAASIEKALKSFRPHVFHFIGHGVADAQQTPQVLVHSAEGGNDPWDAERIRTVFRQAPPRVVVLNACQTAHAPTEASSLVQAFTDAGCVATVAMMGDIQGAASEAFSERFYAEIFEGATVDAATTSARMAIKSVAESPIAGGAAQIRSNWALPRVWVCGAAETAVTMRYAGHRTKAQWLAEDFVARWGERWQAWTAMEGTLRADQAEARLAVLWGEKEAGKRELLNALAEARGRAGDAVVYVDLFGGRTGRWPDVLQRITDAAGTAGFDVTALRATAGSAGSSTTVIEQFRAGLERLHRPGIEDGPVLIVLDGLSDWTVDEVGLTILPELCAPFLRAPADSRLRMVISLQGLPGPATWGRRPELWEPIEVGAFDGEEWPRAVALFRDYWFARVPASRQPMIGRIAEAMVDVPYAYSLNYLRMAAGETR